MYGDDMMEDSKPQLLHVNSFLSSPSPRAYQKKRSSQLPSFIHLTREAPLLVRSSWSTVLHDFFRPVVETFPEQKQPATTNGEVPVPDEGVGSVTADNLNQQVPRMMDAKTAETLSILRRHFSEIPEAGVKIQVLCRLKLKFPTELDSGDLETTGIYAVVVSFSTSGLYEPIADVRIPDLRSEPSQRARSPGSDEGNEPGVRFLDRESFAEKQKQELSTSEVVKVVLEPKQPVPSLIDCHIVFTDEDAQTIHGQLESLCVGIEDLFMKAPVPGDVVDGSKRKEYLFGLFNALWFGCSGPGKLGSEIFLLKGGRRGVGLQGSETSVKLLEAQADRVVSAVESFLEEFVVSVSGNGLRQMAEDNGKFVNALFVEKEAGALDSPQQHHRKESSKDEPLEVVVSSPALGVQQVEEERIRCDGELGCFLVLVFLPPRYHLLLRMEVSEWSTLVRIRTDYWPSLAHVDEFLESFISPAASL